MRIAANTKSLFCHSCGAALPLDHLEPEFGFSMVRTGAWLGIARDVLTGQHTIVLACSERCAHVTIERSATLLAQSSNPLAGL